MPKKILSVLSHTEYGNLEDSDIGLFASAFAPVTSNQMTLLLSEDAVNYAVRGQDGTGIKIAGGTVQPGFLIETDLQSLQDSKIPVYAVTDDLEERGLRQRDLLSRAQILRPEE